MQILEEILAFSRLNAKFADVYLKDKRQLSDEICDLFELGYFTSLGEFFDYLKSRRWRAADAISQLTALAFIYRREDGVYGTVYKDRVIYPIRDVYGKLIAVAGRTLDDAVKPKYINTVFDKSKHLYGLNQAVPFILKCDFVFIVEGYMDVIMARQHNIPVFVGSMGVYLKPRQYALLARYCSHVNRMLDSDEAGRLASERDLKKVMPYVPKECIFVHDIDIISPSKDIDEYLKQNSVDAFWDAYKSFVEGRI